MQQLELNHRDLEPNSIMYIGGLHPRKGLPDLLAAYELIYKKNVTPKLYIVGEGPYSKSYRDLAASLKSSENIIFLGRTESPLSVLAFADVFVLPSHADPAPLVISEAREARCAVIATRIDGIPELLEEGEAGILVQAGNVTEIAQAIAMLTNNKKNMEQWKLRSQINIDRLSVERVALQTIMVYNEVIGKGASDC
ncbi:glycosyltransferase family 4 protein [Methylobacterium sp.]|uniref:glycosyltransferase family 4 protein n=1 Tax=Methylobacterium sp. TaxID=409 RepID=UPI003AFF7FC1